MVIFGLNSASVLAQVNFGTNSASILGIFLAVAGAALYFLRTVRPELSRDQDIFFAAVGLLCGFILIFQGWRLDPILQFGQLLLVGSTVFFAFESIRLRGIATEQAKRNTPIVDRDRPISDEYEYGGRSSYRSREEREIVGVEPLPYYDDDDYESSRPRISGSRDSRRSSRSSRDSRDSYYDDEPSPSRPPRRSSRRSERPERPEIPERDTSTASERPRRRSNSRSSGRSYDRYDNQDWGNSESFDSDSDWDNNREERRPSRRRPSSSSPSSDVMGDDLSSPKPRRRRPSSGSPSRPQGEDEPIPTDYVDYKPIEPLDDVNPRKDDDNDPIT